MEGDDASNDGSDDKRSKLCNQASAADSTKTQCVNEPPTDEFDIDEIEMSSNGQSGD